jgi:hypothetical protein
MIERGIGRMIGNLVRAFYHNEIMIDIHHEIGVLQIRTQVLNEDLTARVVLHSLNKEVKNQIGRYSCIPLLNLKESVFETTDELLGVVVLVLDVIQNLESLEVALPG